MSKKFLSLFLTMLMLIASTSVVCAQGGETLLSSYDSKTAILDVEGSSDKNIVIVVVVKSDAALDTLSDTNKPVVSEPLNVNSGSYSVKIQMPKSASGGKYTIYLVGSSSPYLKSSFMYFNLEKANEIYNTYIKPTKTAESYKAAILSDATELGIDTTDSFYISNKNDILNVLAKLRRDYLGADELYNDYYKAYAISELKGAGKEEIKNIFKQNEDKLGIVYSDAASGMSEAAETIYYSYIAGADFTKEARLADFATVLNEYKLLAEVNAAADSVALMSVMQTKFSSLLSSDSNYKNIAETNRHKVFTEMIKLSCNKYSDIAANFKAAAKSVYEAISGGGNGNGVAPGGSGGSGGGGGGGSMSAIENDKQPSISIPGTGSVEANPTPGSGTSFTDVTPSDWEYTAVSYLTKNNIVNGYGDGSYKPDNSITRAECIKLIYTAFEDELKALLGTNNIRFSDVADSAWYSTVVNNAASAGLIKGSGGNFRPNDFIKREDAAVMINNLFTALGFGLSGNPSFADKAAVSEYALSAVGTLEANKIMNGYEGYFRPLDTITRAEAAQLLYNCISFIKSN